MNNNRKSTLIEKLVANVSLLGYTTIITAIVYLLGYLYISGVNIGFSPDELISIYSFNRINIIDKTYLITGIKCLTGFVFPIIFSLPIMEMIKTIYYKDKTKTNSFCGFCSCVLLLFLLIFSIVSTIIQIKTYIIIFSFVLECIIIFIIKKWMNNYNLLQCIEIMDVVCSSLIIGLSSIYLFLVIAVSNFNIFSIDLIKLGVYSILFTICNILIYDIRRSINKIKININEKMVYSIGIGLKVVTLIILISSIVVYDGSLYTIEQIDKYMNENGELDVARLHYSDSNKSDDYICIENTGDYFVGYSVENKNVKEISKDKIEYIEYMKIDKKKERVYDKYISGEENENIIKLINEYYNELSRGENVYSWLKENSSDEYYKNECSNIEPKILDKKYKNSSDFKNMINFIGIECSKPKKNNTGDKYTVKVIEVWKDSFKYKTIDVINKDNTLKIDTVSDEKNAFVFETENKN